MKIALLALLLQVSSGKITQVADGFKEPFAVEIGKGGMYVAEYAGHCVSVIDASGKRSTLAGTGEKGLSGDGGPAAAATFNGPHHLLFGPDGGLYVADTFNHCVRRIDVGTGVVTRVAGTGEKGYAGDGGPAVSATFSGVFCLALDPKGERLYVCDLGNRRVRAVTLKTGTVETVAGNGEKGVPKDGESAKSQPLVDPRAIAADSKGNLYILERGGHALRVVDGAGRIRTVAGTGKAGFSGDGGPALEALLKGPKHVVIDLEDNVLITDTENHAIRKYLPGEGRIVRVAGTGEKG
ncbi:MAG: hypothetical protein AAB322_07100, partial [Pseudomonadota bacterium]